MQVGGSAIKNKRKKEKLVGGKMPESKPSGMAKKKNKL